MIGADERLDVTLTVGVLSRRVIAWLIDSLAIAIILAVLSVVLFVFGLLTFGLAMPLLHTLWIVPTIYTFAFIASASQASPGQMLCGLRVVRDTDLGRPTPAQAIFYAVGFWLTIAAGAIWLLAALLTRRSRCLHDIVSGTVVVRTQALTIAQLASNMGSAWSPR